MTWRQRGMLALVLALAVLVVAFRDRVGGDLWPPDRSFVGPNLLANVVQAAVLGLVLVLVWPPARRRIHAFADRKLEAVHIKLEGLRRHHDAHRMHVEAVHADIKGLRESVEVLHSKVDSLLPM